MRYWSLFYTFFIYFLFCVLNNLIKSLACLFMRFRVSLSLIGVVLIVLK